MATDVDIHVGKRLRRRRRLLGLTQQDLAGQVGVRFQQIQKYECGANRVTASRLFSLSTALNVNINYFFDGLAADGKQAPANDQADRLSGDILSQKETLELVRAYYRLSERPRRRLLDLAKALEGEGTEVAASYAARPLRFRPTRACRAGRMQLAWLTSRPQPCGPDLAGPTLRACLGKGNGPAMADLSPTRTHQARALLPLALKLADAARAAALPHFRSHAADCADNKATTGYDPVTEADRAAERAMRVLLSDARPDDGIEGEEYGSQAGTSGLVWHLDPVDGTRAFVAGLASWTTLIGLAEGERAILGIIDQGWLDERYVGIG